MRVNKETAQKNRASVVKAAAQLFREHGFDGIGISSLMKEAGLTNGAFYKQFDSKDSLALEATEFALEQNREAWRDVLENADGTALEAFREWYLSNEHIRHRGHGCAFSTLATEAPRRGVDTQAEFANAIEESLELLSSFDPMTRAESLKMICTLVGALTLARAVGDNPLKSEIVAAVTNQEPN